MGDGPRSVPQILDAAFRLYLGRFGQLFGIALIAGLIGWLLGLAGPRVTVPSVLPSWMSGLTPLGQATAVPLWWGSLLAVIAQFLAAAAIIVAADIAARPGGSGVPAGYAALVGAGLRRLWPYLVTVVTFGLTSTLAAVLFIVPGVFLFTRWALAQVAAVVEQRGASAALGRSFALVRGLFWHVFGAVVLAYLATAVVGLVLRLPAAIPATGSFVTGLEALWAVAAAAATLPYPYCVLVLLFREVRARKEGTDLAYDGAA